jgi:hypothetical protein
MSAVGEVYVADVAEVRHPRLLGVRVLPQPVAESMAHTSAARQVVPGNRIAAPSVVHLPDDHPDNDVVEAPLTLPAYDLRQRAFAGINVEHW